ncbi:hypothetical protein [Sulfurimonas sp.]|jgi:hypothetical protein|uniref:hypothetical protein n=1 Tax=Sulfurimonas sp. TaxID=2022749 RepID=UPI0025EDB6B5|nr:hypothetical protein [Sulfurimonas sp.]MBT5935647.1 hypothetical protein [Sulfurimonas sp.]
MYTKYLDYLKNTFQGALLVLAIMFAIPLMVFLRAYVLLKLWGWFIVPVFHVQDINFWQSLGILIVIAFLRYKYTSKEDADEGIMPNVYSVTVSLGFLGFSWIIHSLYF